MSAEGRIDAGSPGSSCCRDDRMQLVDAEFAEGSGTKFAVCDHQRFGHTRPKSYWNLEAILRPVPYAPLHPQLAPGPAQGWWTQSLFRSPSRVLVPLVPYAKGILVQAVSVAPP